MNGTSRKPGILLLLVLMLSFTHLTAQNGPIDTCGYLSTGADFCRFFNLLDGPEQYVLENYGIFSDGDTVRVNGLIVELGDTVCMQAEGIITQNSITPCPPSGTVPFDGYGFLQENDGCIVFALNGSSDIFLLENYGDFQINDTVIVSGYLDLDCQSECNGISGCILDNSIIEGGSIPPDFNYSDYGILEQFSDCVLFTPHGNNGIKLELDNYGGFTAGDTVYVIGSIIPGCNSDCIEANGCIAVDSITSVSIESDPVLGNAIVQIANAEIDSILFGLNAIALDSIASRNIFLVSFVDSIPIYNIISALEGNPGVLFAEPNFSVGLPENLQLSISFPDEYAPPLDVDLGEPQSFFNQALTTRLNLDSAHQLSDGQGIRVAVIDNGIDLNHPWLENSFYNNGYDFFDNDPDIAPDTGLAAGHGTFVAGLIRLVAPGIEIIPLRAMNENGIGRSFAIAKAIYYAIDSGAQVINMSLGTYESSVVLEQAISEARNAGIAMVAAAGNDSTFIPVYPAAYDGVIAVSAIDTLDYLADFSNYGGYTDICAYGIENYSSLTGDYDWGEWTGTSFSAPLAAGVCALVKAISPSFSSDDIETHLRYSASLELGPGLITAPDLYYAYGKLDAAGAVWLLNSDPQGGCGDVNDDGYVNISDAVYIINYVFVPGSPEPVVPENTDVNADGEINVTDAVVIINYIYVAGSPEPNCTQ